MKNMNDYMKLPYRMEIVPDPYEGGFVASYPDLPGCISCGETAEAAVANATDAKAAWLQAAIDNGIAIPAPSDQSALEKIEDDADLRAYEEAAAAYRLDPITYSHEEVKKILGLV